MVRLILGILFLLLAVIARALYKTYTNVPAKELKRLARTGDDLAALLYRPVAYGMNLQLLLGFFGLLFGATSLVLLTRELGMWLAILTFLALLVLAGFFLVPSDEITRTGLWLARRLTPGVAWLLERLNPISDALARFVRRHRPLHVHTGLFEKEDIIELLEKQKHQPDNRIPAGEVDLLTSALSFGDKLVKDILVPKRVVRMVAETDPIGPILTDELYKSGHSRFPVHGDGNDQIAGILYLHELVSAKQGGKVGDIMSRKLTYVHENFTLYQTLQAFLRTKRHMFLVVNEFEEFVGIITIEDVIENIIGKPIVDEFDAYDDVRAVATKAAQKDHAEHKKAQEEPREEPEAITGPKEVVK